MPLKAALDEEEIDAYAQQNNEKHRRCNGCAHGGAAKLQLIAEKGAVEKRAQ
jgi:hypothetical protein